jgi:hypothetical protein
MGFAQETRTDVARHRQLALGAQLRLGSLHGWELDGDEALAHVVREAHIERDGSKPQRRALGRGQTQGGIDGLAHDEPPSVRLRGAKAVPAVRRSTSDVLSVSGNPVGPVPSRSIATSAPESRTHKRDRRRAETY